MDTWFERINIIKMTILPKASYRFSTVSIKLLPNFFQKLKLMSREFCDVVAMWRYQCGTITVSSSWLISCFSWVDLGHSQVRPLQVWGQVILTLLAKTNIDIPLDYSMKFKSQWNLNQEWMNIFIRSRKCPCLICMFSLLFLSCIGIKTGML